MMNKSTLMKVCVIMNYMKGDDAMSLLTCDVSRCPQHE